nr:MAG TPA: hypothetical protein [Herelleviridae sp.]
MNCIIFTIYKRASEFTPALQGRASEEALQSLSGRGKFVGIVNRNDR